MQEILTIATIIAPVTSGVMQAIKKAIGIDKQFIPLAAVFIGALLGMAAYFVDAEFGMRMWAGGISGLAATGLFELSKKATDKKGEDL